MKGLFDTGILIDDLNEVAAARDERALYRETHKGHPSQGLSRSTPVPLKSPVFRVTTVNP
jgi:hypothetical protein